MLADPGASTADILDRTQGRYNGGGGALAEDNFLSPSGDSSLIRTTGKGAFDQVNLERNPSVLHRIVGLAA